MSVRQSILAILDQGPCYGYQLRTEFDRRTGSAWPLNVGQIYNTLDRLERDGLVQKAGTDAQGHVFYKITDAGSTAVADWLRSPVARDSGTVRDELAIKLALAATLPGVDAREVVAQQRVTTGLALADLIAARSAVSPPTNPEQLAELLVLDSRVAFAEAELRWLQDVVSRLRSARERGMGDGVPLAAESPKRGRPARNIEAGMPEAGTIARSARDVATR
ncbi:helix-turn-helix transcriptional regulator [Humibacter antri]